MGGAIANIAALCLSVTKGAEDLHVATFASPRVFDSSAAEIYKERLGKKTIRVVNQSDFIPSLPFGSMGYKHVGEQLRVNSDRYSHTLDTYRSLIINIEPDKFKPDNSVSIYYYPSYFATVFYSALTTTPGYLFKSVTSSKDEQYFKKVRNEHEDASLSEMMKCSGSGNEQEVVIYEDSEHDEDGFVTFHILGNAIDEKNLLTIPTIFNPNIECRITRSLIDKLFAMVISLPRHGRGEGLKANFLDIVFFVNNNYHLSGNTIGLRLLKTLVDNYPGSLALEGANSQRIEEVEDDVLALTKESGTIDNIEGSMHVSMSNGCKGGEVPGNKKKESIFLANKNNQVVKLEKELSTEKQCYLKKDAKVNSLQNELKEIKTQLTGEKEKALRVSQRVNSVGKSLNEKTQELKNTKDQLEQERDSAKRDLDAKIQLEKTLGSTQQESIDKLNEAEAQLKVKNDELDAKKQELESLTNTINSITSEKEALSGRVKKVEDELNAKEKEHSKATDQLAEKKKLQQSLDEKTEELKSKDQALEELKSGNDNLKTKKLESRNEGLNGKNKKFSAVSAQSRKQITYASISFVLSGAFAVGASLTMFHLAVCIILSVAALTFLAVGCYCSYKANRALSNVEVKMVVDHAVKV